MGHGKITAVNFYLWPVRAGTGRFCFGLARFKKRLQMGICPEGQGESPFSHQGLFFRFNAMPWKYGIGVAPFLGSC